MVKKTRRSDGYREPLLLIGSESFGYPINIYIVDENGARVNLSTVSSVKMKIYKNDAEVKDVVLNVVDAVNGLVTYTPQVSDFAGAGSYRCRIRLIKTDSVEEVEEFRLEVW
ncbi:MAG: BppU family phage baseplate upper protein [Candidatus Caldarchaeum sp.]